MFELLLAQALFVGLHFVLSATGPRAALVGRLGERGFTGLYAAQAILLVVGVVMAYNAAPRDLLLWNGAALAFVPRIVVPLAILLVVFGIGSPNPTAVMQQAVSPGYRARGIFAVTRHPAMWGIGLWALAHLAVRGDGAGLIFFGGFALLAFLGTLALDAKKSRQWRPESWNALAGATSNLPFLAVAQGRAKMKFAKADLARLMVAIALYLVLVLWFHPSIIGFDVR